LSNFHNDNFHHQVITGISFSVRGLHSVSLDGLECVWNPFFDNDIIPSDKKEFPFLPVSIYRPFYPSVNLIHASSFYGLFPTVDGCLVAYCKSFFNFFVCYFIFILYN
jgi:hypothetical protein